MKIHLTLLIILIFTQNGTSQTKESYDKTFGNFVIKVTDEVTQSYADLVDLKTDSIWSKSTPKFDNLDFDIPKPPPVLVYRKEYKIHFFVKPNLYTQYTANCDNGREIYNILKVDRETLLGTNFEPYFFELRENRWDFNKHTEDEFEILEYFKDDRKTICGFECYKIKIQTKGVAKRTIEMYVTEQIELNYNPAFTNLHLLNKFYPLYIKEYLENYPNDVYKEFVFELE